MISVVIPTRNRADALARTLIALAGQAEPNGGFEVVVVDNGSHDDTAGVVDRAAPSFRGGLLFVQEEKAGPAAARNHGVAASHGETILFLGDDMVPADASLVAGHAALHAERPEPTFGVLGHATWADEPAATPLMRWLEESGVQFDFGSLTPGAPAPVAHFYTANVSLKKAIFEGAGGFDERFSTAALEDVELAVRLSGAGFSFVYEPDLLVHHVHATTLARSLERMERVGRACALYDSLYAGEAPWRPPTPRSPLRDRVAALNRPLAWGRLPLRLQRRAWAELHTAAYDRGYRLGPPSS